MGKEESIREEYVGLRHEIRSTASGVLQIACYSLIAVAAIEGYIFAAVIPLVGDVGKKTEGILGFSFLIPLVIICPSFFFTVSHSISIIRMASYIRKVIEPNLPGLHWETGIITCMVDLDEVRSHTTPSFRDAVHYIGFPFFLIGRKITGKRHIPSGANAVVLPLFLFYLLLGIVSFSAAIWYGRGFRFPIFILGALGLFSLVATFLGFIVINWQEIYECKWDNLEVVSSKKPEKQPKTPDR